MMQQNSVLLKLRAALSVPRSQSTSQNSESLGYDQPRFLFAAWYTELIGTKGDVFGLLARGEPSSALFENSQNLASSFCRLCRLKPIGTGHIVEQRDGLRKEKQDSTIPTPRLARKFSTWNPLHHAEGIYSENCMMENLRNQISVDFQCWKVNFKTEVCANTRCPTIAMLRSNEVETAKSVDDLMTSQSIEGRDFTDFEILVAKIASALKKIFFFFSTSEEEWVSKSSEPKNTTDFHEEDRLLTWSMTTFEQQELVMQLKTYQTCSIFAYLLTEWRRSRFRYKMGSHSIRNKWDTSRERLGRFVQIKVAGFRSTSDCVGFVQSRIEST